MSRAVVICRVCRATLREGFASAEQAVRRAKSLGWKGYALTLRPMLIVAGMTCPSCARKTECPKLGHVRRKRDKLN